MPRDRGLRPVADRSSRVAFGLPGRGGRAGRGRPSAPKTRLRGDLGGRGRLHRGFLLPRARLVLGLGRGLPTARSARRVRKRRARPGGIDRRLGRLPLRVRAVRRSESGRRVEIGREQLRGPAVPDRRRGRDPRVGGLRPGPIRDDRRGEGLARPTNRPPGRDPRSVAIRDAIWRVTGEWRRRRVSDGTDRPRSGDAPLASPAIAGDPGPQEAPRRPLPRILAGDRRVADGLDGRRMAGLGPRPGPVGLSIAM